MGLGSGESASREIPSDPSDHQDAKLVSGSRAVWTSRGAIVTRSKGIGTAPAKTIPLQLSRQPFS